MCFSYKKLKEPFNILLNNRTTKLKVVIEFKYLAFLLTTNLSDALDIKKAIRFIFANANNIISKFSSCDLFVKKLIFNAYCSNVYGPILWLNYLKKDLIAFDKAYNIGFKKFLKLSRFTPTKPLCEDLNMLPCNYLFAYHKLCFFKYMLNSKNLCIKAILNNSFNKNDAFMRSIRELSFSFKVHNLFLLDTNVEYIRLAFLNRFLNRHLIDEIT